MPKGKGTYGSKVGRPKEQKGLTLGKEYKGGGTVDARNRKQSYNTDLIGDPHDPYGDGHHPTHGIHNIELEKGGPVKVMPPVSSPKDNELMPPREFESEGGVKVMPPVGSYKKGGKTKK